MRTTAAIYLRKLGFLSLLLAATNCTKSKSSSSTEGGAGGSVDADVTNLGALKLSTVLNVQLPDSVKGTGTEASLRLLDKQKSFEACELRQKVRDALSSISQVSSTLCHLEQASLEFGKKYNITFPDMGDGDMPDGPDGPGDTPPPNLPPLPAMRLTQAGPTMPSSIQLWIDDSKKAEGVLKVYMCMDKTLNQYFEITGAASGKAKGSIIMKGDMDMGDMSTSYHRTASFDNNFTTDGKTSITVKELMSMTSSQFGTESMRRLLALDLNESDVSKVTGSFAGNMMGMDQTFASVGHFNEAFGVALAKGKIGDGDQAGEEFSNKSFFDGKGYVVDPANHDDVFGAGGALDVSNATVPGYLGSDFTPSGFPADAWDCQDATEDFDLDVTAGDQTSCDEDWDQIPDMSCFDAAVFAQGQAADIPTSDVPPEDFEGLPAAE